MAIKLKWDNLVILTTCMGVVSHFIGVDVEHLSMDHFWFSHESYMLMVLSDLLMKTPTTEIVIIRTNERAQCNWEKMINDLYSTINFKEH